MNNIYTMSQIIKVTFAFHIYNNCNKILYCSCNQVNAINLSSINVGPVPSCQVLKCGTTCRHLSFVTNPVLSKFAGKYIYFYVN